jgi:glyceraldehyde 3-phosphate dehydrogenase (phosphorylating)
MSIRLAINGLGRTGRSFVRAATARENSIDVVAVNDLGTPSSMANLLRRDSVFGPSRQTIEPTANGISLGGHELAFLSEPDPTRLPWKDLGVDVVIESTGHFTERGKAATHVDAGASWVIVSAPCKGADATFIVGVNEDTFDPDSHLVVSNGSCTTNCFVPMVKVLDDAFGLAKGLMTTVHAYTGDQNLVDGPHKDDRRARSAAINIVPTSTGAARATSLVLDTMQRRLDGAALRIPVADGSIVDFTAELERPVSAEEVNEAFRSAAGSEPLGRVLDYSDEPIVSSDVIGATASCIFDAPLTMVVDNLVKVFGWYDNEYGYACRLVDLVGVIDAARR